MGKKNKAFRFGVRMNWREPAKKLVMIASFAVEL
jgi:hypothetical protein